MDSVRGLQFKIRLLGYKPTMFRTIVFPLKVTYRRMANIVLESFRACGGHCFCFVLPDGTNIPFPAEYEGAPLHNKPVLDAKSGILPGEFKLIYDYGDGWCFHIRFMRMVETKKELPLLIKGQGYGIIDDIGGPYALMRYRQRQIEGSLDEEDVWIEGRLDDFDVALCQSSIRQPDSYDKLIF